MLPTLYSTLFLVLALTTGQLARAATILVTPKMHHLRTGAEPEWSNFPESAEANGLNIAFEALPNDDAGTLRLRQQDVKQKWTVRLNTAELGELTIDENDMVVYFDIPAGTLVRGENRLSVTQQGNTNDDIRVGDISVEPRPKQQVLNDGTVTLTVVDSDSREPVPSRITVLNSAGALQTSGTASNGHLAVRTGIVYTSTGQASFGLPVGSYRVIAGRGFEYSIDELTVTVTAGDTIVKQLSIGREVPTSGYIACDPHVHTLTHSGHGDASVQERMITIAAEGIELPIATDHNAHIDHRHFAEEMKVQEYFTPVIGNEVTTRTGHFNIFPVAPGAKTPDHRSDDWEETLHGIFATPDVRVAILNHARDLHGGTTPFGPKLFNDSVGENTVGWHMGFNAMEVVNSGATQTDPMQLFHDWMTLLNRGYHVTPVGSSDSHDVGRHFVGQGRTYIRCDDRHPDAIDVEKAVKSFVRGNVMVSYGLLTELKVNEHFQSGDVASVVGDEVKVDVRILGPHWVSAEKVMLFANGQLIREQTIDDDGRHQRPKGVIWSDQWWLPVPKHDVHLVAIAIGPGIDSLHWKTAKPYQPDTTNPETMVLGCSGAVWLDVDEDAKGTPARKYAEQIVNQSDGDVELVFRKLDGYDEAIAAQVAALLQSSGHSLLEDSIQDLLRNATPSTQRGFRRFLNAWREVQLAQSAR